GVRRRAVGREGEEVFRPTVAGFDGENGEGKVRRETTAGVVLFGLAAGVGEMKVEGGQAAAEFSGGVVR
ncbi:hypothetical protein HAX54_037733, partial [Datura stramonium]|nr:hypothetical protein [Datura stramonium]